MLWLQNLNREFQSTRSFSASGVQAGGHIVSCVCRNRDYGREGVFNMVGLLGSEEVTYTGATVCFAAVAKDCDVLC